ncbi:MAG: MAP7 domain-containing protein [Deltaproteobacteria bacterium]|nr:MAP7 domain-containing protein [Deltaproteobacteria bacterium]
MTLAPVHSAWAQSATQVVAFPFDGNATMDLLDSAYLATRAALVARGATVPERATVRAALPVQPPTDTANIVTFGRGMGGTHVLIGHVTPLTGQYNLEMLLYDVATSRMARASRNIGLQEESEQITQMVAELFAPGAMQATPEELARIEAERVATAERERLAREEQARVEAQRRAEEQRAREAEAQRRAREALLQQDTRRFAGGGVISASLALQVGGRLTDPAGTRPVGAPAPTGLAAGLRTEVLYAIAPSFGLELGGVLGVTTSPSVAVLVGPGVRLNLPVRGAIPLRASIAAAVGLYASTSGNRATTLWTSLDARAEYDFAPAFSAFAGVTLDASPGALVTLTGTFGFRLHFGEASPSLNEAPPANASP